MERMNFRTSPTRKHGNASLALWLCFGIGSCVVLLSVSRQEEAHAKQAALRGARPAAIRRPVALALAEDGRWLFVANQSGTIAAIDTANNRVASEISIGHKLADLAVTADGTRLIAVDEDAGELHILSRRGSNLDKSGRVKVSPTPVSLQIARDGARCTVASLWSRQVSVVALGDQPHILRTVDLPFAPRGQSLTEDGSKLVIADAFGGGLAILDVARGKVDCVRSLPVHNMRGLARSADGKHLHVTHQTLNRLSSATRTDIHWGNLLTNNLRSLPLADVLDPKGDPLRGSDLLYFGEADHGTGDPAGIGVDSSGRMVVALSGVNEVAIGDARGWRYVGVAARPTAVAVHLDGKRAYVANTNADSVSIIDMNEAKTTAEILLGTRPEPSAAERGEMLFHDARLSHDGWMSCHSCHTDGHSNGQLTDTLGDGTYGTPKRVLSLLGVGDTGPWAWNGSITELETQVRKSIETTMHGNKPRAEQVRDLTAYLKTLSPPPSRARLLSRMDEAAVKRGHEVFTRQSCANCHAPPTYTSRKAYDVGLVDEAGHRAFNPPSLRGVSQGGPYFHDGRAMTLEVVFTTHRHQLKSELNRQDVTDLIEFLCSL
jgi:YVTN family beta-propeller protein